MLVVKDHKNIELIKEEIIKQHKTVNMFVKSGNFRAATVQDFLNKKQSVRADTLFEMMDHLGMTITKVIK